MPADLCEFKAPLVYIMRDCLKIKTKQNKNPLGKAWYKPAIPVWDRQRQESHSKFQPSQG